ncbi:MULTISPECIES: D-amino acid dehydrogenase [Cupriavidus]|uniref:D-amino acid dehydrogenase n=1 Tax=Cupriavidus metallidurans TaxID=119219 RepID=A0A482IPS8_9BURK|nr:MULTISPECIES: D-amino acid dehydrogenase [Cupriavidus]KWR79875.1 D-amino acid dehydrogenase small subunit [Cupriavidus sp. SHE]QBP08880.1 D-amino acid dehydrogenase [Cupriavidus metallidurans]QWC89310.1 D-amino acid dehydrogenase [Cupriavidus metallidurans]
MRIAIVGAGVVGMTSAWRLANDGHEVTVVERHDGPGEETSFANGGQLSYSYVAPLAGPGVLSKVPGWLLDRDSPMRFRPSMDPSQWRWLLDFARACNASASEAATRKLLRLSFYSRDLMQAFVDRPDARQEGGGFDFARSGKLIVHRDAAAYESACRLLDYQASLGCEQQALDRDTTVELEPALAGIRQDIVGAIHTPSEEVGDCHRFCVSLAHLLQGRPGVTLRFGTRVTGLVRAGDRVTGLCTDAGDIRADAVIVSGGIGSVPLLKPLGVRPMLWPLKGYSITVPIRQGVLAPRISVTDFANKIVYARIGDTLRVAGMADIVRGGAVIDRERAQTLVTQTRAVFGDVSHGADLDALQPWAGLRPATPTGLPMIGESRIRGLWLNLGHGALGFTLAMGSAGVLADRMAGRKPVVDAEDFSAALA